MDLALGLLKTTLLLTLTGLSLFRIAPRAIREIHSWVDRILLSLLTGVAFYTIFFLLAMGLFGLPLTEFTLWLTFSIIIAVGAGFEIYRRYRHQKTGFEESEDLDDRAEQESAAPPPQKKIWKEILIFLSLALIFYFSLHIRIQNGLRYPDKLLDADPYRHHIRTEALIETGYLSKYDPYLIGEVPIFELQGCYILAGVLGLAGPFSAHTLWLWGAQAFGALSILSLYLFTKLGLRNILFQDLGPPKRRKKGPAPFYLHAEDAATYLGLIAAGLWGASPVHILRTNAGFSESYAIPMLAPALLFYLWASQSRIWGDFVWFGVFFTAMAFINPVPAVFIVPFLLVHAVYVLIKTKDKKWIWGNLLAGAIFFACLMVWNWKFLATPLLTGAKATSHAGTTGILKSMGQNPTFLQKIQAGWETFSHEIPRNLGFFNMGGKISRVIFGFGGAAGPAMQKVWDFFSLVAAFLGSVWILWDRREQKWRLGENPSFFFLSYVLFFLILFLIPFGFISFTSKYYRYLLPISLSLSVMAAYFLWRVVLRMFPRDKTRAWALGIIFFLALVINVEGKTWGGWVLNCTPEEYAGADWIKVNTDPADFIIANWYTGDYLRSLTKRRIIISDYPRVEVRVAKEKYNLEIPILPKDPAKVVEYVQKNPGSYYLFVAKWGPWGQYEKNPHFELLKVFGKDPKTQGKMFRVHPEIPSGAKSTP